MTTSNNIGIIIVEKTGILKELVVKEYNEGELFKKCGFKKGDDFVKQTEWPLKVDGQKYTVALFAKTNGKANTENKYDFPPPVDTTLFFGACAIVCSTKNADGTLKPVSINMEQWNKLYEKLFGGFEDLSATCAEDEEEIDELELVPEEKKTKHGYLKDGFVVDTEEDEEGSYYDSEEELEEEETEEDDEESDLIIEDIGSELSEEAYEDEDEPTN
jgi:hypothetical protein